jgi:hypothetical protein
VDLALEIEAQGYTVTEERQNLVDDELGVCVRYSLHQFERRPVNAAFVQLFCSVT